MEVVEEQLVKKGKPTVRVAKPLQACFKTKHDAEQEWRGYDAEIMPGFLIDGGVLAPEQRAEEQKVSAVQDAVAVCNRLPRKVVEEYVLYARRVRSAQRRGKHVYAIKLTTHALRLLRQRPKIQRNALNHLTLELLNLRSVSLIAVGECGEAWRCINLMAKLWEK